MQVSIFFIFFVFVISNGHIFFIHDLSSAIPTVSTLFFWIERQKGKCRSRQSSKVRRSKYMRKSVGSIDYCKFDLQWCTVFYWTLVRYLTYRRLQNRVRKVWRIKAFYA